MKTKLQSGHGQQTDRCWTQGDQMGYSNAWVYVTVTWVTHGLHAVYVDWEFYVS